MQCYPTKTNEKPSQCCESKSPGGRQILCCFHSFSSILLIIKTHSRGFRGLTAFSAIRHQSRRLAQPGTIPMRPNHRRLLQQFRTRPLTSICINIDLTFLSLHLNIPTPPTPSTPLRPLRPSRPPRLNLLKLKHPIPITITTTKNLLLIINPRPPPPITPPRKLPIQIPMQGPITSPQIIARSATPVRDVESSINSYEGVDTYDDDLDCEVHDVEPCFVVVPCWVLFGARYVRYARAEGGAECEEGGCGD